MFEPPADQGERPHQLIRPVGQFRFRFQLDGSDRALQ
jgi:hypothetical protein